MHPTEHQSSTFSSFVALPPLPPHSPPEFGKPCLDLFNLDPTHCNLNHGSYGACPKYVRAYQHRLQSLLDTQPDLWFQTRAESLYIETQKAVAPLLGVQPEHIGLMPNSSYAWNSVFRSLARLVRSHRPDDNINDLKVMHLTTVFAPLKPVVRNIHEELGVQPIEVQIDYPITDDEIVERVKSAIGAVDAEHGWTGRERSCVCIAAIDAISSVPGVIFPFRRLSALFKSKGIWTFVDGAHALGQIPVDLSEDGPYGKDGVPDFFVSNCHKWLYSPVNSAVLFVNPKFQTDVLPAVIVNGYGDKSFTETFFRISTLDQTALFSIPAAIHFRKWLGGEEKIRSYNKNLAVKGGELLAEMFGTSVMSVPGEDEDGKYGIVASMVNVKLPAAAAPEEFLNQLRYYLAEKCGVSCMPYKHNGAWWIRVSAQIYIELEDFKVLGRAILEVLNSFVEE
ncbi:pyridoxal phosphate-dependent transferase [Cladochytrium replicatum]|nr:pyridoxal phosphate-dependent transferase [Cladochytrium replicatum]